MSNSTITAVGRVAVKPEIVGEDKSTVKFVLAVTTRKKETEFIKCILFSNTFKHYGNMLGYIDKGSLISIMGYIINVHSYISKKDGQPKGQIEVDIRGMSFIPSSSKSNDDNKSSDSA